MDKTLTIIGGTYYESCIDPETYDLYGSGLRAAAALSAKDFLIEFITCIGKEDLETFNSISSTFGISPIFTTIPDTIIFHYYHPLSIPVAEGCLLENQKVQLPQVNKEFILYYGMIEANISVHGKYVVYDPQNHIGFKETGSTAEHLALILNKKEAYLLSELPESASLKEIGESLILSQNAEVIVIKNGTQGALVIEKHSTQDIPVFKTELVWPIGSGDIFSAVFAWKWIISKCPASESAMFASQFTATYCQSKNLPLTVILDNLQPITKLKGSKKIYLAGPFFNICQRWIINELRNILIDFNNNVFSPYHDVGLIDANNIKNKANHIATLDLEGIKNADVVLAVLSTSDPSTLFEIGYAISLNKEIIIFTENMSESDLVMFYGTNCKIVSDFSTAVYMASW